MRFLLDHDVPEDIVFSLEALEHDVVRLREVAEMTLPDRQVLELADEHERVLITCNRDDFLELFDDSAHAGLIILIRRRSRAHERAALVGLLDRAGEEGILRNLNFA